MGPRKTFPSLTPCGGQGVVGSLGSVTTESGLEWGAEVVPSLSLGPEQRESPFLGGFGLGFWLCGLTCLDLFLTWVVSKH